MDPFTLVALATEAYHFVKNSCEMYKQGKQLVMDAAKDVEEVVNDIQTIKKKTKGLLGFIFNLFEDKPVEVVKDTASIVIKKKKEPVKFDENYIFSQVADSLIKFLKAYNSLKQYKEEQEELAKDSDVETGTQIAINLVIAQLQMEKLNTQLNEYMIYQVPPELKDLYTRVNEQLKHIANVQAVARQEALVKRRREEWQRAQKADLISNRILYTVLCTVVLLWTWGIIIAMTH